MSTLLTRVWLRLTVRRDERGDVPGWVLITVMTAGIVGAIWFIAEPQLTKIFSDAIEKVKGP